MTLRSNRWTVGAIILLLWFCAVYSTETVVLGLGGRYYYVKFVELCTDS